MLGRSLPTRSILGLLMLAGTIGSPVARAVSIIFWSSPLA